ncbi:MAG: hypothetical protein CMJ93_07700 [Planctomycetes bacterium]|nr:hypothetical protein [Planctomycetota bacterium]|tara:strand:+ start:449 stop:1000 length:552 start_codon:yes stop_codon:yes gene_type:complete
MISAFVHAEALPAPDAFLQQAFDTLTSYAQPISVNLRTTHDSQILIQQLVDDIVDFKLMAQLSVGRSAWTEATPEVQTEFVETFRNHVFTTYLSQLMDYQAASDAITWGAPVLRSNKAKVPIQIRAGGSELSGAFKLYANQSRWRVYDATVDGVSLVSAFRVQFSRALKTGGLPELTLSLVKK